MTAWGEDQGIDGSMITFMGDPSSDLTKLLQMELTHPGPNGIGLHGRCKRHALYVVDGTVKVVRVAEREDDPAGDDFPESTCAPAMIDAIKEVLAEGKEEL
uniref:Redoxin domain-containing protein n=1 Tax=Helicotheca tamesis TaxID=374047 RepID=A0A7S2ICR4_9STRA|mmetsp:Transcript_7565/g.10275  ORF Transcript_7565/g.10275 Transcript_7565/m.10275 type:complete len:101 (+) Transcript_7565:351-653(+)